MELAALGVSTVPKISRIDLAGISKSHSECTRLAPHEALGNTAWCFRVMGMVTLDSLPSEKVLWSQSKIAAWYL